MGCEGVGGKSLDSGEKRPLVAYLQRRKVLNRPRRSDQPHTDTIMAPAIPSR